MRRYTAAEEEAVRTASRVRDWTESGLIEPQRAAQIEQGLRTGLRRTNWALRTIQFIFAALVLQAAVGLVMVIFRPDDEAVAATLAVLAGIGYFALADFLIARFRLYRFGVEEAAAVCAVALIAAGFTIGAASIAVERDTVAFVAFVAIAVVGFFVYLRFGLLYCAIVAGASAAMTPFFIVEWAAWSRVLAASVLLAIHIVAGLLQRPFDDDFPGDDYGVIESASWLGVYVALNLELMPGWLGVQQTARQSFHWVTYAVIWVLPAVGLYRGIRRKHQWMIRASLLMALATLMTNKLYLGWERRTWDPILLGVLLIATALALRRWLAAGLDGHRNGFTARRFSRSDQQLLTHVALATAALKPDEAVRHGVPDDSYKPGGGRSGGAGAGGTF